MHREAIKLLKILRKPESIEYTPIIYLDENNQLPLVLDLNLTKEIFIHKSVQPFDLWAYYKNITRQHQLDYLDTYFKLGPLLKHEQTHREIRLEVLALYKKLESPLTKWLTDHSARLTSTANLDPEINLEIIESWVLELLCHLLEKCLGVKEIPTTLIPDDFFYLLPSKEQLITANLQLGKLINYIQNQNISISIRDMIPSLTIIIMARQALIFGISQQFHAQKQLSFEASTPVNIIARFVLEDFAINEFSFTKNQTIYLSPYLLRHFHPSADVAFGWGPHQCPGKNLSLMIESHLFPTPIRPTNKNINFKISRDLSSTLKLV